MTTVITKKLKNDVYSGFCPFLLDSSTLFSSQSTSKQHIFKLKGLPEGCNYAITCFCHPRYSNLFARDPSVVEFGIRLTKISPAAKLNDDETSIKKLKKISQLVSVKVSLNGGPKHHLAELSTSTETWASTFPDSIRPVEPTNDGMVWTWKLDVEFWLKFKISGEKNTLRCFSDMFSKQDRCDVNFTFENGRKIGAHIAILAARSPVFAAMFNHDMKESRTSEVEIKDIKFEIFQQLLHYIYSGRISDVYTEMTAQQLFVAADKYEAEDLQLECISYMLPRIRKDNAVSLLVWSDLYSVLSLREATLEYIAINGKDICRTSDWEQFTKNSPDLCILATRRMLDKMVLI